MHHSTFSIPRQKVVKSLQLMNLKRSTCFKSFNFFDSVCEISLFIAADRKWVLNCIKKHEALFHFRSRKIPSKCTQTLKANTPQPFLIRDDDPVAGKWGREMLYYSGVKKLSHPNLAFMWKISVHPGGMDEHLLLSSPLWTQVNMCNQVTWQEAIFAKNIASFQTCLSNWRILKDC